MKLKLTQTGFEGYTGQMGVVFFENGVSTKDVLPVDAVRMAAVMGCEWEDGTPANVSQIYLDNMNTPARSEAQTTQAQTPVMSETQIVGDADVITYTEEQLATIADKSGIAGLREIADPLDIKGKSIADLIAAIMKVAGAPKAE